MDSSLDTYHKFNNDLLVDDESKNQARLVYDDLFMQLNDEYLIEKFRPVDERANSRKRAAHRAGYLAIGLAVASLLATAFSPVIHTYASKNLEYTIVILAVLAGLLAAVIGCSSVLYGKSKRNWLHERLKTEKLRQLHFQRFIFNCRDTCKLIAGDMAPEEYSSRRDLWTDQLLQRLNSVADSEIVKIIEIDGHCEPWLPRELSGDLVSIVDRMLRRDPNDRFQNTAELVEALLPHAQDANLPELMPLGQHSS